MISLSRFREKSGRELKFCYGNKKQSPFGKSSKTGKFGHRSTNLTSLSKTVIALVISINTQSRRKATDYTETNIKSHF